MADELPLWLQGRPLPFQDLEPDQFERFVAAAFDSALAAGEGWKVTVAPDVGADLGFDFWARRADGGLVCGQAKRLKDALGVPGIALEAAKVALVSHIYSLDVREHRFIAAGTFTADLTRIVGSTDWSDVVEKAAELAASATGLEKLRADVPNPSEVVRQHLAATQLGAWNGRMLDARIGARLGSLAPLVERTFQVHSVFKTAPRPPFDEPNYLDRLQPTPGLMPIRLVDGSDLARLEGIEPRSLHLLIAPGGAGKTTALSELAARVALQRKLGDGPLPVFVDLGLYRGNLDHLVRRAMRLSSGSNTWQSLPGPLLLLLDGLDRVPAQHLPTLCDDLGSVDFDNTAKLVSMRGSGPRHPVQIEWTSTHELARPTAEALWELARARLGPDPAVRFLDELWVDGIRNDVLLRPYGVMRALERFELGEPPARDTEELVLDLIRHRLASSLPAAATLPPSLQMLDLAHVLPLFACAAAALRLDRRDLVVSSGESLQFAQEALLRAKGLPAAEGLSPSAFSALLRHADVFESDVDGGLRAVHDLEIDVLAGPALADEWRDHIALLDDSAFDEVWLVAAPHVAADDRLPFLEALAAHDVVLAARAARDMEAPQLLETRLLSWEESAEVYFDMSMGLRSLRVLGTETCMARLNQRAALERASGRPGAATRELLLAGDRAAVELAAEQLDRDTWGGLQVDGIYQRTWNQISPQLRLSVVRDRLGRSPRFLGNSALTLLGLGSQEDLPLIRWALEASGDIIFWCSGAVAIADVDHDLSTSMLNQAWEAATMAMMPLVVSAFDALDVPFDPQPLLDAFLAIEDDSRLHVTTGVYPAPPDDALLDGDGAPLVGRARTAKILELSRARHREHEGPSREQCDALGRALAKASLNAEQFRSLIGLRDDRTQARSFHVWAAAEDQGFDGWVDAALQSLLDGTGCPSGAASYLQTQNLDPEQQERLLDAVKAIRSRDNPPWLVDRLTLALARRVMPLDAVEHWISTCVCEGIRAWSAKEVDDYVLEAALMAAEGAEHLIQPLDFTALVAPPGFDSHCTNVNDIVDMVLARSTAEEFATLAEESRLPHSTWLLARSTALPWWAAKRDLAIRVATQLLLPGVATAVCDALSERWNPEVAREVLEQLRDAKCMQYDDKNVIEPGIYVSELMTLCASQLERDEAATWLPELVEQTGDPHVRRMLQSLLRAISRQTGSRLMPTAGSSPEGTQ